MLTTGSDYTCLSEEKWRIIEKNNRIYNLLNKLAFNSSEQVDVSVVCGSVF